MQASSPQQLGRRLSTASLASAENGGASASDSGLVMGNVIRPWMHMLGIIGCFGILFYPILLDRKHTRASEKSAYPLGPPETHPAPPHLRQRWLLHAPASSEQLLKVSNKVPLHASPSDSHKYFSAVRPGVKQLKLGVS